MVHILDSPFLVLAIALVVQIVSAYAGDFIREKIRRLRDDERDSFSVVQTAALTLLGLIIGFSFSMAVSRYDQRKNLEEAEANAIGTEYLRADLLPADAAAKTRELLTKYLDQRVAFYTTGDQRQLEQIEQATTQTQADLWTVVHTSATAQPTPVVALAVAGMNDVLNSEGYTRAAWSNRVPVAAWALMGMIAVACNLALGYGQRRTDILQLVVVPLTVSISFFLIADIDSPRGGVIPVLPHNLLNVARSMSVP